MEDLKQWYEGLRFAEPSYFNFFYLTALMAFAFLSAVLLKIFKRPKKTKYSRYKILGKDVAWLLSILLSVLGIVALAKPGVRGGYTLSRSGSVDVLVCLDESFSMKAGDIKPSRQEAAKAAALSLAEKNILRPGDRVTLFAFGGIARWRLPLSEDLENFKAKILEVSHPEVYEEDNQLDTDFSHLLKYLPRCLDKQDGFAKSNRQDLNIAQHSNSKVVILISDGNDEEGGDLKVETGELNKRGIKVYTIGVGTNTGAKVSVKAYSTKDPFNSSLSEQVTIKSALEMKTLEKIARLTGGSSFAFDDESKQRRVESFLREAVDSNRSFLPRLVYSDKRKDIWWEVLAIPSVILLMLIIWRIW